MISHSPLSSKNPSPTRNSIGKAEADDGPLGWRFHPARRTTYWGSSIIPFHGLALLRSSAESA
jgi:hypothetical protein